MQNIVTTFLPGIVFMLMVSLLTYLIHVCFQFRQRHGCWGFQLNSLIVKIATSEHKRAQSTSCCGKSLRRSIRSKPTLRSEKPSKNIVSKEDFAAELRKKLEEYQLHNQSTAETLGRSRNERQYFTPSHPIFDATSVARRKFPSSKSRNVEMSEHNLLSVFERSSKKKRSSENKSVIYEDTSGWKEEIDIDSILGSANTTKFERLVDEYHNIEDSGLKISNSGSSKTFDSARRKQKFFEMNQKPIAGWAQDKYIRPVCRLQKCYIKNQ